jgi:tetratricopeptide (TPR) repeat protein
MRGLFPVWAIAIAAIVAGGTPPAAAQSTADAKRCSDTSHPDQVISGCTRIIDDPRTVTESRVNALGRRATAHGMKKDFESALGDINRAITLSPKTARLHRARAILYAERGDRDLAIQNYDEAIRLDPKYLNAISERGQLHADKEQHDRALIDLNEALRIAPNDAWSYNARARVLESKGDTESALRDYDAAIRFDAKNPRVFLNRGALYRDKGDLDRALSDFDAAIRLDPKFGLAYSYRGRTLRSKGETEKARANLQRAIELDPTLDAARVALAELSTTPSPNTATPPAAPTASNAVAALTPVVPMTATPAVPTIPEKRVALVIGNGAYQNVATLPNPSNDARAVADALRKVGFTSVRSASNLKRDALVDVLKAFAAEAESADWAVVYYAGHGIEVGGINWLIPVDAALKTDRDVQFEAVAIEQVLGAVDNAKKLALVVLDACRDNPFTAQMRSTSATRSVGRGLAPLEPRRGTLVAYAAKHGQTAMDGTGANSPFVTSLVRHIQTPGLEINKVFRLVRDDVLDATNSRQEPFIYGTLPAQDFFFAGR